MQIPFSWPKLIIATLINIVYLVCLLQYFAQIQPTQILGYIIPTLICFLVAEINYFRNKKSLSAYVSAHISNHLFLMYFSGVLGCTLFLDHRLDASEMGLRMSVYLVDFSYLCCILRISQEPEAGGFRVLEAVLEETQTWGAQILLGITIGLAVEYIWSGTSLWILAFSCGVMSLGMYAKGWTQRLWVKNALRNSLESQN